MPEAGGLPLSSQPVALCIYPSNKVLFTAMHHCQLTTGLSATRCVVAPLFISCITNVTQPLAVAIFKSLTWQAKFRRSTRVGVDIEAMVPNKSLLPSQGQVRRNALSGPDQIPNLSRRSLKPKNLPSPVSTNKDIIVLHARSREMTNILSQATHLCVYNCGIVRSCTSTML